MSREIKFRAWLKDSKLMVDVDEIDIGIKFIYYYYHSDDLEGELKSFKNIELIQYTGLKDKNNKEIYEGDIVILHNDKYKVIFNSKEARFVLRDDEFESEIPFTNNNNERMEIIGNIYENPELLGEQ